MKRLNAALNNAMNDPNGWYGDKKKITNGLIKVLSAIMIGFIPHGNVER